MQVFTVKLHLIFFYGYFVLKIIIMSNNVGLRFQQTTADDV